MSHKEAAEYYNLQPGGVLHHIDIDMKVNDPERYAEWRIEDVVPMPRSEHIRYHQTVRNSMQDYEWTDEQRAARSARVKGENNPMYGVHRYGEAAPTGGKVWTDEQKKHASEGQKRAYKEHPENFKKPEGFMSGEKNPMYGKKQSDECKRKIGIKCKLRAAYRHGELTKEEFEFQYANV